jgi:hypothetical protein
MQPDHATWDEFTARRTAQETGEEPEGQPKPCAGYQGSIGHPWQARTSSLESTSVRKRRRSL